MATLDDTHSSKRGAPRKYKTCKCGVVGHGTKVFPSYAKGMCSACWSCRNSDPWIVWAKVHRNKFFASIRREEVERRSDEWTRWAIRKRMLIGQRNLRTKVKTGGVYVMKDWDHCVGVIMYRNRQRQKYREMNKWDKACHSWKNSLRMRRQQGNKLGN